MARNNYSDETKAAVMAALLEGQSVTKVSKDYNVPRGTVAGWSAGLERDKTFETVSNEKKIRVGELLISYLEASLRAMTVQAEVFGTRDWLIEQSASEAAVLHGVMMDKAIKLLEAFSDNDAAKDNSPED